MLHPPRFGMPAVAAAAAAVAALALPASPALAASGTHLCDPSNTAFCAAASSLTPGIQIHTGSPGRALAFVPSSNGGTFRGNPTGTLKFTGASDACVVDKPDSDIIVYVESCSADGHTWAQVSESNGTFAYINVAATGSGANVYLSGPPAANDPFIDATVGTGAGYIQKFAWK